MTQQEETGRADAAADAEGAGSRVEASERRREAIRASLEQARATFHELLASMTDADLQLKGPGSKWTVGEVLTHTVSSFENTPALIGNVRRGKDYMNYPYVIFEFVKLHRVRWAARGVTREQLARRLDAAYPSLLALVDTIGDDEWERTGRCYGEPGWWTVEHGFRHQLEHIEEHAGQIWPLLGERT